MPPQGYLQRLREICDKHGIVLIFDEVITGFGRTGQPFAAQSFGVTPDLITCAKGLTSGAIPMGGVLASKEIYDTFMTGPENMIEFFHGYTYSGHPMAAAAGLATMDVYAEEGLFERVNELAPVWEDAIHSLKGLPHVIDLRNYGLVGAVELAPIPGAPMKRAMDVFQRCWDEGVLIRTTGDIIALSPPLVVDENEIGQIVDTIGRVLKKTA